MLTLSSHLVAVFATTISTLLYLVLRARMAASALAWLSLIFHFIIVWIELGLGLSALMGYRYTTEVSNQVVVSLPVSTSYTQSSTTTPRAAAIAALTNLATREGMVSSSLAIPISGSRGSFSAALIQQSEFMSQYRMHVESGQLYINQLWSSQTFNTDHAESAVKGGMPLWLLVDIQRLICRVISGYDIDISVFQNAFTALPDLLNAPSTEIYGMLGCNSTAAKSLRDSRNVVYDLWRLEGQLCLSACNLFVGWHYIHTNRPVKSSNYLVLSRDLLQKSVSDLELLKPLASPGTHGYILGNINEAVKVLQATQRLLAEVVYSLNIDCI